MHPCELTHRHTQTPALALFGSRTPHPGHRTQSTLTVGTRPRSIPMADTRRNCCAVSIASRTWICSSPSWRRWAWMCPGFRASTILTHMISELEEVNEGIRGHAPQRQGEWRLGCIAQYLRITNSVHTHRPTHMQVSLKKNNLHAAALSALYLSHDCGPRRFVLLLPRNSPSFFLAWWWLWWWPRREPVSCNQPLLDERVTVLNNEDARRHGPAVWWNEDWGSRRGWWS